ncbi:MULTISPECIES: 50S ribosomal protein L21 [Peptoniphilus]|uniref:Large ribosomal subunit protein bL21 n=1 Tax=Peptoniphilus duerdenii ATCC BAA-1640 TaxID=862517 RepID=E0NP39_9FIRM|nr:MULTISPECIES: 50S ribosomal protein L21 [Peptoniphilus]EFM24507.1 ribosomal protein L21 [Peptoniphilus duerdenii ATCC BAA-1640]ERT63484.1 ribosomal protein L21 [Peptoniphilus sp. BV3AC2]MDK8275515.1 50S ribosomal protein L21 [Peptoniphilus duerdenii]
MYAVIETGGKQYQVKVGDKVKVEKLNVEEGDLVTFDRVLAIGGEEIKIGTPVVSGAKVEAKVLANGKGKKVITYKYKAKKNERTKKGHRQPFTLVEITNIA